MSRKKDPKDVAIDYVMNASVEEASTFVQTLASVVKARAAAKPSKGAASPATPGKPAGARASRPPARTVEIVSPGAETAAAAPPVGDAQQQELVGAR